MGWEAKHRSRRAIGSRSLTCAWRAWTRQSSLTEQDGGHGAGAGARCTDTPAALSTEPRISRDQVLIGPTYSRRSRESAEANGL